MAIDIAGYPFEQKTSLDDVQGKGGIFAILGVKGGTGTVLSLGDGADMAEELARPEHATALTSRPVEELALVVHEAGEEATRASVALDIKKKMGIVK